MAASNKCTASVGSFARSRNEYRLSLPDASRLKYCTAEHDSLKISNGKWYWWSRGFGGYSALDYLMKVKEYGFVEAVESTLG